MKLRISLFKNRIELVICGSVARIKFFKYEFGKVGRVWGRI